MRQEKLLVNVEIVGVNRHTETDPMANSAFTSGTVLPWLQDTTQANVWTRWNIAYRDIVILDSSNYVSGVINLTYNDLALSANRDRLKEMLRRAVNGGDNDADKLPDHWEYRFFGDLNALPGQDSDGDGYDNSLELAFGANPKDPVSFPRVTWDSATQSNSESASTAGQAQPWITSLKVPPISSPGPARPRTFAAPPPITSTAQAAAAPHTTSCAPPPISRPALCG